MFYYSIIYLLHNFQFIYLFNMKLKLILNYYWKSLIIIACILYLSFAPPSTFKGVPTFEFEDKLVHLLMYGGLTLFMIFDYRRYTIQNPKSGFAFILICIIIPILLGGAVEILQPMYFAPRTAEWMDWFSDIAGIILGWSASLLIINIFKKVSVK